MSIEFCNEIISWANSFGFHVGAKIKFNVRKPEGLKEYIGKICSIQNFKAMKNPNPAKTGSFFFVKIETENGFRSFYDIDMLELEVV